MKYCCLKLLKGLLTEFHHSIQNLKNFHKNWKITYLIYTKLRRLWFMMFSFVFFCLSVFVIHDWSDEQVFMKFLYGYSLIKGRKDLSFGKICIIFQIQKKILNFWKCPWQWSALYECFLVMSCLWQVLIVGAGPCGLRMAIECALLGAKVVVIDMRSYISRNNVLHLWPFVIQDIKLLGGKIFHSRFCVGAIDHVSKWYSSVNIT